MNLELQSRTPKHGLGRDHAEKLAVGDGRVTSTSQSDQKQGHCPVSLRNITPEREISGSLHAHPRIMGRSQFSE
jgi:hypothetical protein